MSLQGAVDPKQAPRLTALTKPENDATTRVCATSLLGTIQGPEADAALAELKNDNDRRVRFQALHALAKRGSEGRKAFMDLWKQPDTTPAERGDIVNVLSGGSISDSIMIFMDAVRNTQLDESVRILAAQTLGRVGNQSALQILNECAEKDSSEKVRAAAKTAAEAVSARLNKAAVAPGS